MTFDPIGIIPAEVLHLITYDNAEKTLQTDKGVQLNKNENALGSATIHWHNRFPNNNQSLLLKKIAHVKNTNVDFLSVTKGNHEALELLLHLFCKPGTDNVIVCSPANEVYNTIIQLHHIELRRVLLTDDMMLDLVQIEQIVDAHTKLIIIESPHSVTGNSMLREDVELILNNFKGIVLLDETYVNFSRQKSYVTELTEYKNLVVLQNFDIAWGLANLQVAILFSYPTISGFLHTLQLQGGVSNLIQDVISEALNNVSLVNDMIKEIVQMRVALKKILEKFPFVVHVYASDANFLLVRVKDSDEVYTFLLHNNIVVKHVSKFDGCKNCLRITIGTEEENTRLVECFVQYFDLKYKN